MDLKQTQINWLTDILHRIIIILNDDKYSNQEKITAISWLAKQGMKIERED
jgi:hypothetical protein